MGRLYDAVRQIEAIIERRGLDAYETKGRISLEVGFFLAFVSPDDPDDEGRSRALQSAVESILGESLTLPPMSEDTPRA